MATGEVYDPGTTYGTMRHDANSSANTTWTAWAEDAVTNTFGYWIGEQGSRAYSVCDDGPTLDAYPGRVPMRQQESGPESEEDKLAREREEEEARLAREKEEREEKEAERKANVLLLELIGRVDYKKFCRSGYIDVEGNSGKVYRIRPRAMTKVFAGKDKLDVALESLCIAMKDSTLPRGDEMVWKKLMIESNEEAFVKTANHFDR